MVKFHEQIILLTRKNLKIRFSHCCASCCELFIPIFITAIIGLLISSTFSGERGHHYSPIFGTDYAHRNDTNDVDVKFKVCNTKRVWSDNSATEYQCERKYNGINSDSLMKAVKAFNVTYLIDKRLEKKGHLKLAENIIAHILNEKKGTPTNWTRSTKTEKELEICMLHEQKACQWIYAVVIITDVRDDIQRENKFVIEYKIRFKRDVWSNRDFYTDRLFIDFTMDDSHYTNSVMDDIEKLYMSYQLVNDLTNFKDWFSTTHSYGGFALIQTIMDQGILKYIAGRNESELLEAIEPVQISLVRMPFVYATRDLANRFSKILSVLYCLMFSLTIFSIMRVNSEKCSGFKELLRMHGVSAWTQWMAWLFTNFVIYGIWTALLTFLLCFPLMGGPNFIWLMGINCFIYWLILILLVLSITTFCFLISVFFEKVWTAVSIGLVCWILLTVFMTVISSVVHTLRKWTIIGLMLMPTVAFDVAIKVALGGGTLRTLGVQVNENVPLTMLHCLFMLILDNFLYMTLAIYLDNVLSSKYGVRKPPLYFLRHLRKFVMKLRGGDSKYQAGNDEEDISHTGVEMSSIISGRLDQPFQSDPEHVEAAVVIQNLRKEFKRNKKRAVDGLTAKMFSGEIYALLGFNGAGKTTTINVLTGLTSPTNGIARIFDLDIRKDMEEIRKYIGLCPQHNLLFDEMTVWDQVAFFGKLKGLSKSEDKARDILTQMGMFDKLNNKPGKLSGGQKRRVHLAIALIGDTKLAFLDEPTSGLDPETRRGVWDILIKLRGKTTMILTTHDMEEADLLGDRIGIMSEGKMICSGTGSFLKKYYGVGYNLKMSAADPQCDPEIVYNFVRGYIPSAKMNFEGVSPSLQETSRQRTAASISISLPTADLDLSKVADLMEALREQHKQLQVDNIGLSLSTMDEVFLKVGEEVQAVTVPVPTCDPSSNDVSSSRLFGTRLTLYRYKTLVHKRMMYFCSAPFTMIFLITFFSSILLLALITISYAFNSSTQSDPPRVVSSSSLSSYKSPIIFMHEQNRFTKPSLDYTLAYLAQLHSGNAESIQVREFPKTASSEEIVRSLRKATIDDIFHYRQYYIAGASFGSSWVLPVNITGYFSAYALHSAPLSLNLISQTLIKKISGVDAKIGVVNHPFKSTQPHSHITPERIAHLNNNRLQFTGLRSSGVFLTLIVISLLTGTSALLPAEERLNKGKHLQIMTGTTSFIYWSAMFTWDFLFFTLVNTIITVIFVLADYLSGNWVFTNNGAGWIIFLILECHAFGALWFCYLISWAPCVKTGSDAFLIVNKFAIIVGILWSVIRQILISITCREVNSILSEGLKGIEDFGDFVAIILYYGSDLSGYIIGLVPMYSLYLSLFKLFNLSLPNSICNWFPKDVLHLACDKSGMTNREEELFMHSCCENCREGCFKPQPYFNSSSVNIFTDGYETHSMIFDIFMMILSGIVFAGVIFALEYWPAQIRAKTNVEVAPPEEANATTSGSFSTTFGNSLEEDVESETTRVNNIVKDDALETANHALISHNLKLNFGKLQAVKGLSFGVNRGECFGLLGVNGAGKTSTFRMITGDIFPTSGNVYAGGLHYYKHRTTYLSSLGYCPQFDGIIGSLTGLQMLKLYGALRGIPPERLQVDATIWLDKFGLLGSANKKCGHYSGGMKRRLSAAIALIGNPKLLLLDEPTTGVDPAFRQQFWNVIKEIRESGQSVLLTSHTMDECEALCTRLGIMVAGQFMCLGNIQHLKCKFGSGYILTLKLKRVAEEEEREHEEKVNLILEKIVELFTPCRLQTKQLRMVQYQILNKSLWYCDLFRNMEQIRNSDSNHEIIEEYSITETSLEDVFISFARKQTV